MSKGFKILLVIIFTPVLGVVALWLFLFLFLGDPIDYLVARTIPKYPNATEWKVEATSGFPDGRPGADISFYTGDNYDSILAFYSPRLKAQGWKEDVKYPTGVGGLDLADGLKAIEANYTMRILSMPFTISIRKTDIRDPEAYRDYVVDVYQYTTERKIKENYESFNRAILFVDRHN